MRGPSRNPKKQLKREIFTSAICVRLLLTAFLSRTGTFEWLSTIVISDLDERTEGVIDVERRRVVGFPGAPEIVGRSPIFFPSKLGTVGIQSIKLLRKGEEGKPTARLRTVFHCNYRLVNALPNLVYGGSKELQPSTDSPSSAWLERLSYMDRPA
jgi:hypothetical protein